MEQKFIAAWTKAREEAAALGVTQAVGLYQELQVLDI